MVDDLLEQRLQRAGTQRRVFIGIAVAARRIEDREVELLVGGVQRHEQVEHLVQHFLDALVRAVDLVDDDDGAKTQGRSEEHTSELQSLMRISYAVFRLKKKTKKNT